MFLPFNSNKNSKREGGLCTKTEQNPQVRYRVLLAEQLADALVHHGLVEGLLLEGKRGVHDDLLLGGDLQRHVRLQPPQQERSQDL